MQKRIKEFKYWFLKDLSLFIEINRYGDYFAT